MSPTDSRDIESFLTSELAFLSIPRYFAHISGTFESTLKLVLDKLQHIEPDPD